jgi:hypothetical protein
MQSSYYAVMPSDVRYHTELTANAKLIFAEIMACLEKEGVCVKNNIYFSRVFNMSKDTASRSISSLRKYGFINIVMEYEENTKKFKKRYITPIQNSLYLNNNSKLPYVQNNVGGNNNSEGELQFNGNMPSQNTQSLLYNNNSISKVYTNGNSKDTKLNNQINGKQKNALYKIVKDFYNIQESRHPNIIEKNWNDNLDIVNGSINILYDLIKKDGFEYDDIKNVISWAVHDKFWGKTLLSIKSLRKKSENGFTKFQNIQHKYLNGR